MYGKQPLTNGNLLFYKCYRLLAAIILLALHVIFFCFFPLCKQYAKLPAMIPDVLLSCEFGWNIIIYYVSRDGTSLKIFRHYPP